MSIADRILHSRAWHFMVTKVTKGSQYEGEPTGNYDDMVSQINLARQRGDSVQHSPLWQANREKLRPLFVDEPGCVEGGVSPFEAAQDIIINGLKEKDPDCVDFAVAQGTEDPYILAHALLRGYFQDKSEASKPRRPKP